MSNGKIVGRALGVTGKTVLEVGDYPALVAGAVDVLRPYADTPAKQGALDRLGTSALRLDDLPALDELEAADGLTPRERLVVERARRAAQVGPIAPPEPPPDPQLERLIAEALGMEAAATVAARDAMDQRMLAAAELSRAKNPSEVEARTARLRETEQAYRVALEALERARALTGKLERQRDVRRRALLPAESTAR